MSMRIISGNVFVCLSACTFLRANISELVCLCEMRTDFHCVFCAIAFASIHICLCREYEELKNEKKKISKIPKHTKMVHIDRMLLMLNVFFWGFFPSSLCTRIDECETVIRFVCADNIYLYNITCVWVFSVVCIVFPDKYANVHTRSHKHKHPMNEECFSDTLSSWWTFVCVCVQSSYIESIFPSSHSILVVCIHLI